MHQGASATRDHGPYHLPTTASILDISALLSLLLPVQDGAGAVIRVLGGEGDTVQHGPDARADGGLGPAEPLGETLGRGGLDVNVGPVDMALVVYGRHASGRVSV